MNYWKDQKRWYRNDGVSGSYVGSLCYWSCGWMDMETQMGNRGKRQIELFCVKSLRFIIVCIALLHYG